MINGQEMEMALGLPIYVDSFLDKKPRLCTPIKLANLHQAKIYLSIFSIDNFEENIEDETKLQALIMFLANSFVDMDLKDILGNIDASCFSEVMQDILQVSGILLDDKKNNNSKQSESSTNQLNWLTSMTAIQVHTSNTYSDIQNMTLRQFHALLDAVGTEVTWGYKLSTIGSVKNPDKYIQDSDHPLHNREDKTKPKKTVTNRVMTMKDIAGLKNMRQER